MKKVIALLSIVVCFAVNSAMAQGGGGGQQMTPEQRTAMMKERLKDLNLTSAQMDSVIAISNDARTAMMGLRELAEDQRAAKMKEVNDARTKRMEKALGAELAKKVADAMPQRGGGGRPGGGQRK